MACWIPPDPPTLSVHWRFKAVLTDITRTGRWREAPSSPGVCNTNSPPSQNATAPRLEFNRENTRNNLTERRKKEANDRSLEGEVQISANGCYLPQRNCDKVIFSQASVSHSVHSGGGGVRGGGGVHSTHASRQMLRDTVSERAVRILLECILVLRYFLLCLHCGILNSHKP